MTLPVDIGDKLKKGEVLFTLDDRDLQTEKAQSEIEIQGAKLQVPSARLAMEKSELAFNRNRHGFPTGDLKRSENQGYFILETLRQLAGQRPGPAATLGLLANLGRHARLVGLGWADAYRLGRLGLSLDPANVRNVLIPVGSGVGTRLAVQPSARDLFADFADDAVLQRH